LRPAVAIETLIEQYQTLKRLAQRCILGKQTTHQVASNKATRTGYQNAHPQAPH
jgi:hypothetical protein